ncbi:unnamed protein product [Dicrocoelium dendriticum]|nr:unnamed protein product [Dicrocoelium dendriticum]
MVCVQRGPTISVGAAVPICQVEVPCYPKRDVQHHRCAPDSSTTLELFFGDTHSQRPKSDASHSLETARTHSQTAAPGEHRHCKPCRLPIVKCHGVATDASSWRMPNGLWQCGRKSFFQCYHHERHSFPGKQTCPLVQAAYLEE